MPPSRFSKYAAGRGNQDEGHIAHVCRHGGPPVPSIDRLLAKRTVGRRVGHATNEEAPLPRRQRWHIFSLTHSIAATGCVAQQLSHVRHLPSVKENVVIQSSRRPSPRSRPAGSSTDDMHALCTQHRYSAGKTVSTAPARRRRSEDLQSAQNGSGEERIPERRLEDRQLL